MPRISVDPAAESERRLIEGLFHFYIYDFAEMYGPGGDFHVGADGLYEPYPHLGSFWQEPDRRPFLIRVDGKTAGFVLLNRVSHLGAEIDHAVSEFFVLRPFRRCGAGAAAARWVFRTFSGRWELAIAAPNAVARRFWPAVVAATPGVCDIRSVDLDETRQSRRILSFTVEQRAV